MPTILPAMSSEAPARKTAMQTSQLHMMAFTTVCPNVEPHFFASVARASSAVPYLLSPQ